MAEPRVTGARKLSLFRAPSHSWKLTAVVVWLVFSVTLAAWWLIFGLQQLARFAQYVDASSVTISDEVAKQHRMLLSEGATLIALLFVGGIALLYYIRSEIQRTRRLREFFAAFTHDLKTSLASLRLQAESLEEDLRDSGQDRLMRRLVRDTVRLELQLENSLLIASPEDGARFLLEPIRLTEVFQPMLHHWPDLEIEVDGDAVVRADQRALESIFKNLLQNAVVHGRATRVWIKIERTSDHVTVQVQDNGRGFNGDVDKLGEMFERHGSSSGSGLGLYLATKLARVLGGELHFRPVNEGFCVEVVLPKAFENARSIAAAEAAESGGGSR